MDIMATLGVLGPLFAIITFVYAIRTRQRKRLTLGSAGPLLLLDKSLLLRLGYVPRDPDQTTQSLYVLHFAFRNTGNRSIKPDDVDEAPTFQIDTRCTIVRIEVTEPSNHDLEEFLEDIGENTYKLRLRMLNPRERISFRAYFRFAGDEDPTDKNLIQIVQEGRIADTKLTLVQRRFPWDEYVMEKLMAGGVFVFLLFGVEKLLWVSYAGNAALWKYVGIALIGFLFLALLIWLGRLVFNLNLQLVAQGFFRNPE